MNRYEEIKQRWSEYKENQNLHDWIQSKHEIDNVEYLLSRIEIAQKALEDEKEKTALAVNKMCGGNVKKHVFEDTRSAYYAIDKALQQIRS